MIVNDDQRPAWSAIFESIHPFEDGNGRNGRAVSEKLLAQSLSSPAITGMASTLLKHRKAYYAELERAHRELEITDWLLWFAAKAIEAQRHTLRQVEFIREKSRLLDRIAAQLNTRQERALIRLFAAGPDGFLGGMSAANYMRSQPPPRHCDPGHGGARRHGRCAQNGREQVHALSFEHRDPASGRSDDRRHPLETDTTFQVLARPGNLR